jgi:hypothetical protein
MSPSHRWLLKWARTLHVYLTLCALALLLFFGVTGFMLNHEDWFSPADPYTHTLTGAVPTELLEDPDRLGVVELLRRDYGAVGALDSFEGDDDNYRVVFKAPGRRVEANIRRPTGELEVTHETRGAVGVMLDLHRGKATGRPWGLVIDIVAGAICVISATGLILWSSLRARGRHGLLVIVVGLALAVAVYLAFVP